MKLGQYRNRSLLNKLCIWLGITAVFFLLFFITTTVLMLSGADMGSPTMMRWILTYQNIFLFILPALMAACLWSAQPMQWLRLRHPVSPVAAIGAVLIMIVALPGNNLLAHLNEQIALPDSFHALTDWMQQQQTASDAVLEKLMGEGTWLTFAANLFVIAILAAIGEEFCFRGVLQGLMGHTQRAIWLTAFIFSFIHFQFDGFFPRLLMGALFGYVLVWSGCLWLPIIMHCVNNASVTVLYYIAQQRGIDNDVMDAFGTGDTLWVGIISWVLIGIGIYCLRRSLTINNASSRTSSGS